MAALAGVLILAVGSALPATVSENTAARGMELRPVIVTVDDGYGVEYRAGTDRIGAVHRSAPAGIALLLPGESWKPVVFGHKSEHNGTIVLGPKTVGALTLRLRLEPIHGRLVRQTLEVSAAKPQRFATSVSFFPAVEGTYASFSGVESQRVLYDTMAHRGLVRGGSGDEHPGGQTFPVASIRSNGRVYGVVADSPAHWENRSLVLIDPPGKRLAILNGDGRPSYPLTLTYADDCRCRMDGWQSLGPGQSRRYVTWLFTDKARSQYDVQLAAHIALANAKGWNHSALEAILRNTAYLLLRRNLMRPEGGYLFTSGSNQGFHCGALLAARELGFSVTDADVQRAIAGYRGMYNRQGKFMPTSLKRQQTIGQDTLYGEALTYAVFGRTLLTDQQVTEHMRTSLRIKTPYGFRIISQADGSLLPGHGGVYTYGGSWFLCDAANYLVAGVHGMARVEVNRRLLERLGTELAFVPAFNESISTVNGRPYGNILYSWNSGYAWLRGRFRARLGHTGADPVETALDEKLGVVRDASGLRLEPERATLRPISSSHQ